MGGRSFQNHESLTGCIWKLIYKVQAMSWGATDCYRLWQNATKKWLHITGYNEQNMRKSEQDNRFYAAKTEAPPLTTTGFELIKKKVALGGISKREHDITGYVASRMVRPKSLRKIVNYTQPVMT